MDVLAAWPYAMSRCLGSAAPPPARLRLGLWGLRAARAAACGPTIGAWGHRAAYAAACRSAAGGWGRRAAACWKRGVAPAPVLTSLLALTGGCKWWRRKLLLCLL